MRNVRFSATFWIANLACVMLLTACSTTTPLDRQNTVVLNLNTADRIKVGVTSTQEAVEILGAPNTKIPGDTPGAESWLYCQRPQCNQPRVVISVDLKTNIITSIGLALNDNDPERDLAL